MIKCKSEQVFRECKDYTLGVGANILFMMKSGNEEVLIIHRISVYNSSQANTADCHFVVKHNGDIRYIWTDTGIVAGDADTFEHDLYLVLGDEVGIIITPNAAGDTIEVTLEGLRVRDDEYETPT